MEKRMEMDEMFDNITVPYFAQVSAKLGKDKILQVCKICKPVILIAILLGSHPVLKLVKSSKTV